MSDTRRLAAEWGGLDDGPVRPSWQNDHDPLAARKALPVVQPGRIADAVNGTVAGMMTDGEALARSLWSAATLPGDVATGGRYAQALKAFPDANTEEGAFARALIEQDADGRVFDLAGLAMTGGLPAATRKAGEAVLGSGPIRAAPSLPMDEVSRTARARELGFDIKAYHGTGGDFPAFDNGRLGSATAHSAAQAGHFFTADPKVAHVFAPMENRWQSGLSNQNDYMGRANPLKYTRVAEQGYAEGSNILPVRLRMENPYKMSNKEASDLILGPKGSDARDAGGQFVDRARALQEAGHDGVIIPGAGRNSAAEMRATQYVVFDPSNIRSRFAAFDPAKAGSSDLLAALPYFAALPPAVQWSIGLGDALQAREDTGPEGIR